MRQTAAAYVRLMSPDPGRSSSSKQGVSPEEWDRESIEAVKRYRARHGRK